MQDNSKFLAFKNIRYADSPTEDGSGRWLYPLEPQYREPINNGSVANICPQMVIGWVPKATEFMLDFNKTLFPVKWLTEVKPEVSV